MTSTDLARSLAIPLDTPGCWGCARCGFHNLASDCGYCDNNGEQPTGCLWPMPDSGLPGAELWRPFFEDAIGAREMMDIWLKVYAGDLNPTAALYAAWKEQKNGSS